MERLDAQKIHQYLSVDSQNLLKDIQVFAELESTNSWLLENKHCNTVCLAEKQTMGRGRRGNNWLSPDEGNIYLSLSWCFNKAPDNLSLLSLIVGVSLCESLQLLGLQEHALKLPNDIYVKNQKLAGILIDSADNMRRVIIGIGLNLYPQDEKSRCGLQEVIDDVVDRDKLIANLLDGLIDRLCNLDKLSFDDFNKQWRPWDKVLNQPVVILQKDNSINGIARGINESGEILVEMETGKKQGIIKSFHSAEISLRW